MTSKIELTRNQVYGMWIIITVLILVLLLVLLKWPSPHGTSGTPQPSKGGGLILDGIPVPVSPAMTDFLKERGYPVIMLPHENGGIKLVNRTGKEIPPCKSQERETGVECPPFRNVDVEAIELISILTVETGNPKCQDYDFGNGEVRVHANGTYAGLAPCEPSGSHSHSAP